MESAFAWLNQLIETFYRFFPHILIVRATHGGVKWVRGKNIKPLSPGLHIYWPLTTEVEVLVTARQTLAIPDQVLATKDGKKVVVKTLVVYKCFCGASSYVFPQFGGFSARLKIRMG